MFLSVRTKHPDKLLSTAIFPEPSLAYNTKKQDFVKWIEKGYIDVPYKPGLGFDGLNEDLIRELNPAHPKNIWVSTDEWNDWDSHDRLWS